MLPELVAQPAARRRFELEARVVPRIPERPRGRRDIGSPAWTRRPACPGSRWSCSRGRTLAAPAPKKRRRLPRARCSRSSTSSGPRARRGAQAGHRPPRSTAGEHLLATPRRPRGELIVVKVFDFGIARVVAEAQTQFGPDDDGPRHARCGWRPSTWPGWAPSRRSTDVWPLGLLAFRMLTGAATCSWKTALRAGRVGDDADGRGPFMHPMPSATQRAAHYKCPERISARASTRGSGACPARWSSVTPTPRPRSPRSSPSSRPTPSPRPGAVRASTSALRGTPPHPRADVRGARADLRRSARAHALVADGPRPPHLGRRAGARLGDALRPGDGRGRVALHHGPARRDAARADVEHDAPHGIDARASGRRALDARASSRRALDEPRAATGSGPALGGNTAEQAPLRDEGGPGPEPARAREDAEPPCRPREGARRRWWSARPSPSACSLLACCSSRSAARTAPPPAGTSTASACRR